MMLEEILDLVKQLFLVDKLRLKLSEIQRRVRRSIVAHCGVCVLIWELLHQP